MTAAIGPGGTPAGLPEVDIAIVCEATYPFLTGGLSAVVHQFCTGMSDLTLGVIHIAWDSEAPLTPVYELPDNVAWVHTVFTSMAEYPPAVNAKDIGMPRREFRQLAERIFEALQAHHHGDDALLWSLYDYGINPLTRTFDLWPVLATEEFMDAAIEHFGGELPLTTLFWRLRNFSSVARALTSHHFPRAKVYHSHTTGGAAVLAAAAARQHQAHFLLTEHNLFVRDSVNLLLQRSGSTVVTRNTCRELETYLGGDGINPTLREVTGDQRAWMTWYTALGEISYRAADRITYLYPEAITEAIGLGTRPEIAEVIPNGIDTAPYLPGRAAYAERLREIAQPGHQWKLAFAARVVVIKGLLDLIEAIAELAGRGVTNFTLDIMGPIEEEPGYVEACVERIAQHQLSDRIRFIGTVHIPSVLPSYDLLVLPSHNEGAPIILLEALALGIPTLATQVGGVEAILTRRQPDPEDPTVLIGPGGTIVSPGVVAELADGLAYVLTQPEEHAEHSANAVRRAERLFHIDLTLERYSQVLADLGAASHRAAGRHVVPDDVPRTYAETTAPRRAVQD